MSTDKSTLALTLAEKDLERIISQTIQAQVAAAFSARGGDVAGKVIERLLTEKVDGEMVKSSIIAWIKDNEGEIRKAVVAQMNKKQTKDAIANALLTSLVEATASQYRFNIAVTVAPSRSSRSWCSSSATGSSSRPRRTATSS